MARDTFRAVSDALDLLASGNPKKSNGKITAVNLAKESGVSKATLYRLFDEQEVIRNAFDSLRKNGISLLPEAPETIEQAYRIAKEEVKKLRTQLAELKKSFKITNKLKAHKIQVLWADNQRLQDEVLRNKAASRYVGKVVEISTKK